MKEEHVREHQVLQALGALAENDREREAPPEVEARLLGAFHSRRRFGRGWMAIAATAAALAFGFLLWPNHAPKPVVGAGPQLSRVPKAAPPIREAEPAPKIARAPRKVVPKVAAVPESREVVTDFFPLMNPAPSFERGEILRVQLPAAAMQTVGLPVREEHLGDLVQADVLVGEEGMPRAIRFVRFDVK